ncbi:aspartate aminotransferase family protein [Geomesophilobacter sediminis]|uniref:Aspartate aminotransferase family protein n=1 Tax=Geomesophilobacter sediminis TaxID=2798584 RepID=A0A8J7M2M7_9BACT|nr:aspartate aminotransferase family protein [Geomesophilobacter sediminis]MBJ6727605.1 aspartate aminotransferase family protein [Geomesophilobacter sediminis]
MDTAFGVSARAEKVFPPVLHHYHSFTIAKAHGCTVVSTDGNRYLDFSSGLAVLNVGYGHPEVLAAVHQQVDRFVHTGSIYHNESTTAAAEELVSITPSGLDMLFFGNSGAEAVEASLKLSRYVSGRQAIVSFTGAFHGRTFGALSVTTSNSSYRRRYHPLLPSVYQLPYPACFNCPLGLNHGSCGTRCLQEAIRLFERQVPPDEVAAVIIEPFLGEGGYYPAPPEFLQGLRTICDEYGILLIFDEVQSGIGRTGKWFFCEHADVTPDILVVAKALASGFPLGAVVAGQHLMAQWEPGAHGSTFGGNPVACAAARATLQVIKKEGLLARGAELGERALARLRTFADTCPWIGDVRGYGLMMAIEIVDENGAPDGPRCSLLIEECLRRGLMVINCGMKRNIVRIIPPLTVTDAELDEGLTALGAGLEELDRSSLSRAPVTVAAD